MLKNAPILAFAGVDTAENAPLKVWRWRHSFIHSPPQLGHLRDPAGVVRDGAVHVDGEGADQSPEHAEGSEGDAVHAGDHVRDADRRADAEARDDAGP